MVEDLRANPTVHEGNVELQFVFFSQERKALSQKGSQARLCSLILQLFGILCRIGLIWQICVLILLSH